MVSETKSGVDFSVKDENDVMLDYVGSVKIRKLVMLGETMMMFDDANGDNRDNDDGDDDDDDGGGECKWSVTRYEE